ncbi:MAG: hypothetical protein Q4G69_00330 [Planctomycetia bacterium]|nr:hypothetical protein [Planctomycetia bacterium]
MLIDEIIKTMYYLTRHDSITITSDEELFFYANKWPIVGEESLQGIDRFGRNRTDRIFLYLCKAVHSYTFQWPDDGTVPKFHSLFCRKEGDKYMVKVVLNTETVEGELFEIFTLYDKRYLLKPSEADHK